MVSVFTGLFNQLIFLGCHAILLFINLCLGHSFISEALIGKV